MVVALLVLGDQLAGRHHDVRCHVRPLVEELGGREHQHAVVLGNEEEAVGLKQGPGWVKEIAGAKRFTSSAVRFLVRSVTVHRSVLRVPTNTTPLEGPTAI